MKTINADFTPTEISENAQVVLEKRYLLRSKNGKLIEDAQGMFHRVANAVAEAEYTYGKNDKEVENTARKFYEMMASLRFLPNSPTLMNAGTEQGTLSACFVLPLEDTMEGIAKASHNQAMVQKFGGGTGFSLTEIRPKGWPISTTHGKACGPIEVLKYLSATSTLVTQGGKRDGANMAVMSVHHPDILEFITCKTDEGAIHNFNISVGATDEFMKAVRNDTDYSLYFREYPSIPNSKMKEVGRLNARKVFTMIIEGAWRNGEPGMIFLDEVNRNSPVQHIGEITATNPCGEQPLLPYESCNLGSINVANLPIDFDLDSNEIVDKENALKETIKLAVRFLDNTIDVNQYSIPEIQEMNLKTRKIGLGVMGFADLLVRLRIPYDNVVAMRIGEALMRYIQQIADETSVELGHERGAYLAWHEDNSTTPLKRNACTLTVAPTGTISMIAGCSSGIEPLFSLAYRKHNILGGDTTLFYTNPEFEEIAKEDNFYSEEIVERLANGESLEDIDEVPESIKSIFRISSDITPEGHVMMQAAFQKHVDAAISKTINFPNKATREDVAVAYLMAWEEKCKGITVYRAGSRDKEVLTTGTKYKGTIETKAKITTLVKKHREPVLHSKTIQISTGRGKVYVTIAFDSDGKPFEVFTNHGKAGGNDSAMAEALSRMISLGLRSGVSPQSIAKQLINIQDTPHWDNGRQILSVPDGIAKTILDHCNVSINVPQQAQNEPCPECNGVDMVAFEEGCFKCYECGYAKC